MTTGGIRLNVVIFNDNKKDFLDLLLLADEQEDMIDKYLDRGVLFALYDDGLKSICWTFCCAIKISCMKVRAPPCPAYSFFFSATRVAYSCFREFIVGSFAARSN